MAHLSRVLASLPAAAPTESLGDQLLERVINPGCITTLLDCLPESTRPALYSSNSKYEPLTHVKLRESVANFALPSTALDKRLGPNDRVLVILPAGPVAALAIISVMCYHTAVPLSSSCTYSQLRETVQRSGAKVILTTSDAEERLHLQDMRSELGLEVVYLQIHPCGLAGLFDLTLMHDDDITKQARVFRTSKLQPIADQSLLLHSVLSDGTLRTVLYSARDLIISACAVVKSWDLKDSDTCSESL